MRTNIWVGRGHRRQARDQRDAIERRSHALTTGRVARSEHALKQPLQVPYADTRSSPAPTGTGLVKFVRLGGSGSVCRRVSRCCGSQDCTHGAASQDFAV
jgi:hypothetical protein